MRRKRASRVVGEGITNALSNSRKTGAPVGTDYLNTAQAEVLAAEVVPAGIPWVEVGTPLIKAAGLDAVRAIRAAYPGVTLVADMKVMDAGRVEVEAAAKAGADVVMRLVALDATVTDCIAAVNARRCYWYRFGVGC